MDSRIKYDPKGVGEKSEAQVLAAFLKADKVVLKPFGDNQRYDLVIDEDGQFFRVQCKTGRLKDDGMYLEFSTCSWNWNTGVKRTYTGQVELFAVYCREADRVYVIPVSIVGSRSCRLRLKQAHNGQTKRVRFGEAYLFDGKKKFSEYMGA